MDRINLAIIGAQKAGTTSLKNYLSRHPNIVSHPQLEFSFFKDSSLDLTEFQKFFDKCFTEGDKNSLVKLAKNVSICNSPSAIKRLHEHNPDCKLIYLLREPVDRLISAYNMEKFNGWLKYPIEDIVEVIDKKDIQHVLYHHFLAHGLYSDHIKSIKSIFKESQLKVVLFEDLKANPNSVVSEIFDWLGLSKTVEFNLSEIHNSSKKARSKLLSRIIFFMRTNESIKAPFRKILPYWLFTKVGQRIISFNKSGKKPPVINSKIKKSIQKYYLTEINKLKKIGINVEVWEDYSNTETSLKA